VLERLCLAESLDDGSIDLATIAQLNDALLVRADNERMYAKHQRDKRGH
jgi:hypothetical protein